MPTIDYTTWSRILGTGSRFPFHFGGRGETEISTGVEHVKHSIIRILSTRIGTQFMRREFGSRLHTLLFENNDDVLKTMIPLYVKEAIERWEPRVSITSVQVIQTQLQPEYLYVRVEYFIHQTHTADSLVYPFYRNLPLSAVGAEEVN